MLVVGAGFIGVEWVTELQHFGVRDWERQFGKGKTVKPDDETW